MSDRNDAGKDWLARRAGDAMLRRRILLQHLAEDVSLDTEEMTGEGGIDDAEGYFLGGFRMADAVDRVMVRALTREAVSELTRHLKNGDRIDESIAWLGGAATEADKSFRLRPFRRWAKDMMLELDRAGWNALDTQGGLKR